MPIYIYSGALFSSSSSEMYVSISCDWTLPFCLFFCCYCQFTQLIGIPVPLWWLRWAYFVHETQPLTAPFSLQRSACTGGIFFCQDMDIETLILDLFDVVEAIQIHPDSVCLDFARWYHNSFILHQLICFRWLTHAKKRLTIQNDTISVFSWLL